MGLDLVEMVMRVEEEFEIQFPAEDASKITTPGELIGYLMSHAEVAEKWSRDYVNLSIWMIIEDELGVNREDFNNDSRFIEDMGAG